MIVRQNHHENELAFNAASADLIMQPSLVTARRILLQLISPLIQDWLDYLESHPQVLEEEVFPRLRSSVGSVQPALWTVQISDAQAPAAVEYLDRGGEIRLVDLLRDARNRDDRHACVPLVVRRGQHNSILPQDNDTLSTGDEILLCSRRGVEHQIRSNLANIYTLEYLVSGEAPTRGVAMGWLRSKLS